MKKDNNLLLRNDFEVSGELNMPIVKKQYIDLRNISLIPCSNARYNDTEENKRCGIHFFVHDWRFEGLYYHPERSIAKYMQYAFLLTPDFSTYADMNLWRQIESVAHNRWCGAYWQSLGLTVIPTVSWSTAASFDFCFDGIEQNSIVAIGMIGCKRNNRLSFMRGYNAMMERIQPEAIICYGEPFDEMFGNLIVVNYIIPRIKKEVC